MKPCTMTKILIVDDDPHIREVLRFAVTQAGYACCEAANGRLALEAVTRERPDLMVLDLGMPELDGSEVCRRLRADPEHRRLPIVFLSARDDEIDRVLGLELGGDDYLGKPFSPRELIARIRAVLRRLSEPEPESASLQRGRLRLDAARYEASWDGQMLTLTVTEFGILQALLRAPGRVLTRDQLMQQAYELHRIVSDRTIDSHVRRLRAKFAALAAEPIQTVHGVGYRLGDCL
jgi:two-component system OmpR family response regulator